MWNICGFKLTLAKRTEIIKPSDWVVILVAILLFIGVAGKHSLQRDNFKTQDIKQFTECMLRYYDWFWSMLSIGYNNHTDLNYVVYI